MDGKREEEKKGENRRKNMGKMSEEKTEKWTERKKVGK